MPRAHRILAAALLVSLAIHLLMLASAGAWWTPPSEEIPFPIEASLVLPPPLPHKVYKVHKVLRPKAKRAAPPAAPSIPAAAATPPPTPAPDLAATAPAAPTPPPIPALAPPAPAPAPEPAPAPKPSPPPLRQLPEHLNLRYAVQAGEGGFNLGEAFYSWQQRAGHYSLVSIVHATGLVSLFISGRLVQTSEGAITPDGLQPEQYWLSRNEHRQDTARFDWSQGRLVEGDGGVELPPGSQDVLSFPFHLAMTVDESIQEWHMWVSNGRKLQDYLFHNLGRERLTFGEAQIETLHLQGGRAGEGTLDVWLAPSRHWLPLRIRTLDQKGKILMLSLEDTS